MEFITTTQLRTRSSDLVSSLLLGKNVRLLHRSKIVGLIQPVEKEPRVFTKKDAEEIMAIARKLNLPKLSDKEMDRRYRAAMMKKHGQYLSGHK